MRCESCGYQNVSHASKCIKCNESLSVGGSSPSSQQDSDVAIKKTVIGKSANPEDYIDAHDSKAAKKTLTEKEEVHSVKKEEKGADTLRGTINPWNQARYESIEFIPMAREGQEEDSVISFKNDVPMIELNRDNLDPDNPTITRKIQAELTFSNGNWKLQDKSSVGTFLKLSESHTLKDGDQILMGDRIFTVRLKK